MTWSCAPACARAVVHLRAPVLLALLSAYPLPTDCGHCHWVASPEMVRHAEALIPPGGDAPGGVYSAPLPGGLIGESGGGGYGRFGVPAYVPGWHAPQTLGQIEAAAFVSPQTAQMQVSPVDTVLTPPAAPDITPIPVSTVPEPASWAVLAFGVVGLLAMRRAA